MVKKIMARTPAYLLNSSNKSGNVLDRDWIFNLESMALALDPGLVNQDTSVSS